MALVSGTVSQAGDQPPEKREEPMSQKPWTSDPVSKEPWFAKGVRFRCTSCGACCYKRETTVEYGIDGVWLDVNDLKALRKEGHNLAQVTTTIMIQGTPHVSLRHQEDGACVFLKDRKCSIWGTCQPYQCRTFPLGWKRVMASKAAWDREGERCEGIDSSHFYNKGSILEILRGEKKIRPGIDAYSEETS